MLKNRICVWLLVFGLLLNIFIFFAPNVSATVSDDDWFGISSINIDSVCGENGVNTLAQALDGIAPWRHTVEEIHWFVLDFGQSCKIKKLRARCSGSQDPIDVNIYIDDNNPPTTLVKEGISVWQDTAEWVEVVIPESVGRFIKVEIEETEDFYDYIQWYAYDAGYRTIFDVYGHILPNVIVYPLDGATDICPCSDALCVNVTADYNFNITVYGRIQNTTYWNVWNKYVNVSADEYCFCLGPNLYVPAYIFHHTNYTKTVGSAGTWYNVQFPELQHEVKNINFTTSNNDTFRILYDGEYRIAYRLAMDDSQAIPTSEAYGRILRNGDEICGTLQSKGMNRQNAISSISSHVIEYMYAGEELKLQFTADSTTVTLRSHTAYGDVPSSAIFSISRLSDNEQRPIQYNTTYEWYVNVSKFDNSSLYTETGVYTFTTASDYDDCIVSAGGGMGADVGIVGIVGILGLLGVFWGRRFVKRRRNNNNNRYYYRY